MKLYTQIIIAILLLAIGSIIGWYSKPSAHTQQESTDTPVAESTGASTEIWTCSMHPQVRQNEFGICPICEMDLIPLDNSSSSDDPKILKMSPEAAKLAQVETFIVGQTNSNAVDATSTLLEIKLDGTVEIDERSLKTQATHIEGRIESMEVTYEGQYISKGQVIAKIFSEKLLAASQELITAISFDTRVEGIKDAAIQKLKNWKITDEQIKDIIDTRTPIQYIDIYAEHSGYVLHKKTTQGDYVRQGQALYVIGSTNRLWLLFNAFESDLDNIRVGQKISFTTPSLGGKTFATNISYIEPFLNPVTRTAVIRAEINNTANQLKPGMLLNGLLKISNNSSSNVFGPVTIPSTAVLWTGNRSVVYVQLPGYDIPTYEFREVEISSRSKNFTTISKGLKVGDQLVTHGAFAIDASAQLNNNKSMINRNVEIKEDIANDLTPDFTKETPDQFKEQLNTVILDYLEVKNALVLTDPILTRSNIELVLTDVDKVDMTLLNGKAHLYWMDQLTAIRAHGEKIKNSADVEIQRDQFDFLSRALINAAKAFGTSQNSYYIQYCPMAKGNQGADWISAEKEIRNPYFGDKMLKCGTVKLELF